MVVQQRVGVAAQRRNQRFEQGAGIGHRVQSRERHADKHAVDGPPSGLTGQGLAMCQAPFMKPSPVVSPGLVSLAQP